MEFSDLPEFWQNYFSENWTDEAQDAWGSIDNYLDAFDSTQFTWLAEATGNYNEAVLPDSDFSIAYADWEAVGFDRDSMEYAYMLAEAGYFDSAEDAADYYDIA